MSEIVFVTPIWREKVVIFEAFCEMRSYISKCAYNLSFKSPYAFDGFLVAENQKNGEF